MMSLFVMPVEAIVNPGDHLLFNGRYRGAMSILDNHPECLDELMLRLVLRTEQRVEVMLKIAIEKHLEKTVCACLDKMPGIVPEQFLIEATVPTYRTINYTIIKLLVQRVVPSLTMLINIAERGGPIMFVLKNMPDALDLYGSSLIDALLERNTSICLDRIITAFNITCTFGTLHKIIAAQRFDLVPTVLHHMDTTTKQPDGRTLMETIYSDACFSENTKASAIRLLAIYGAPCQGSGIGPSPIVMTASTRYSTIQFLVSRTTSFTPQEKDILVKWFKDVDTSTLSFGIYLLTKAFHGREIEYWINDKIRESDARYKASRFWSLIIGVFIIGNDPLNCCCLLQDWIKQHGSPKLSEVNKCIDYLSTYVITTSLAFYDFKKLVGAVNDNLYPWWTPEVYSFNHLSVKHQVHTILLISRRYTNPLVPREIWLFILGFLRSLPSEDLFYTPLRTKVIQ